MRLTTLCTIAILSCATAGFACECGSKPRPDREQIVKRFDQDGDGKLDDAERAAAKAAFEAKKGEFQEKRADRVAQFKEKRPELFAKVDTNGDGSIDESEREAMKTKILEKRPQADKNGDGKLDRCDLPRRGEGRQGAGEGEQRQPRGDNGRRAHGNPADNGHDHGRRGPTGE